MNQISNPDDTKIVKFGQNLVQKFLISQIVWVLGWQSVRLRSCPNICLTISKLHWIISTTGGYLNNLFVGLGFVQNITFCPWTHGHIQRKKVGARRGRDFSNHYCGKFSPPKDLAGQTPKEKDVLHFLLVLQKLKAKEKEKERKLSRASVSPSVSVSAHDVAIQFLQPSFRNRFLNYLGPSHSLTLRAKLFAKAKFWKGCTSHTVPGLRYTAPLDAATFLHPYRLLCSPGDLDLGGLLTQVKKDCKVRPAPRLRPLLCGNVYINCNGNFCNGTNFITKQRCPEQLTLKKFWLIGFFPVFFTDFVNLNSSTVK